MRAEESALAIVTLAVVERFPVPSALSCPSFKVPADRVVPPEYVFEPLSVSDPPPEFERDPVPEIAEPKVRLSERLVTRVPLFAMVPSILPVVDPAPI